MHVRRPQALAHQVQGRLGDVQLARVEHEVVPQVRHLDREERRVQPHHVQERLVQARVVLGVPRPVEGPHRLLLLVQHVQPRRREEGRSRGQEGPVARGARAVPALLHALHQPRPVAQDGDRGQDEDGGQGQGDGDAGREHVDGLPVPCRGQRGAARVPVRAALHVRLRLLPRQGLQPQAKLRDAAVRARAADGGARGHARARRQGHQAHGRRALLSDGQEAARQPLRDRRRGREETQWPGQQHGLGTRAADPLGPGG
mmetsp:Transcript_20211/g.51165  ORF Transcript_20211/g.51165 Transcript_20211/m.51165 type:complete len:258 (+) Transcript_20211:881-1654(+)